MVAIPPGRIDRCIERGLILGAGRQVGAGAGELVELDHRVGGPAARRLEPRQRFLRRDPAVRALGTARRRRVRRGVVGGVEIAHPLARLGGERVDPPPQRRVARRDLGRAHRLFDRQSLAGALGE